ncbi:MAG TPA: RNA polymerase sigma factor [Chloroflexota bacterium]|nr:RNA polymerase sigma factor [Chloroflexota bacterium]
MHEEALFRQIYDDHRQAIHAYLLGRTGDPETALDLVQETFLRAWRNLPALEEIPDDRRRYWLFSVARNVGTDHFRRDATRSAVVAEVARQPSREQSSPDDPPERAEKREGVQNLDRALRALPEDLRTALVMNVLAGMTSVQIGNLSGVPAGTIRYRIALARKHLAAELQLLDSPPARLEGTT